MTYETKDSGQRQAYSSGMVRDTTDNKPDLFQWMPLSIPYNQSLWYRMGMLAQRGAQKYGRRNWEKAGEDPKSAEEELERFKSSALRHMQQYLHNETDEDHASAVVFNLMAAEMVKYKIEQRQMMHDVYESTPEASQINWKELVENSFFKSVQEYAKETPWTEEEHYRTFNSFTINNPLLSTLLTEESFNSLDFDDIDPAHEQLSVINHPDFAWVWEDDA